MTANKIVQFVSFETKLGSDEFIKRWEQFTRSVNADFEVTLQQSEKNGVFTYIAQHYCDSGEFNFFFTKLSTPRNTRQLEIKVRQLGGYSTLQEGRSDDVHTNESKILAFLTNPHDDLDLYRQLLGYNILNIYDAFYENCTYSHILEFFVKSKYVKQLLVQLKQSEAHEIAAYVECAVPIV